MGQEGKTYTKLIKAARASYDTIATLSWRILDCRYLESSDDVKEGEHAKVFSNAALHWILQDSRTKMSVPHGVYKALKPRGTFVFEMGGVGNVTKVHTAILAAAVHRVMSIEEVRETSPWSLATLMQEMLEETGFQVQRSKTEYRRMQVSWPSLGSAKIS